MMDVDEREGRRGGAGPVPRVAVMDGRQGNSMGGRRDGGAAAGAGRGAAAGGMTEQERPTAFIVDCNVGRLAGWLRMLGYDTLFINPIEDGRLVEISRQDGRIVLTRDTGILQRRVVRSGEVAAFHVQGDDWRRQLAQVVDAFDLRRTPVFDRCVACNTPLEEATREAARDHVPAYVHRTQEAFLGCPGCGRYYWPGTHLGRMRHELERALGTALEAGR